MCYSRERLGFYMSPNCLTYSQGLVITHTNRQSLRINRQSATKLRGSIPSTVVFISSYRCALKR